MRNCAALSTRNVTASFTHGLGSHIGSPVGPASGCHTPGTNVPKVHDISTRPSCPSASIASAAIVPTSIPAVLARPVCDSRERGVVRRLQRCVLRREERVQHPERRSCGGSLCRGLRVAAVDEIRPAVAVDRVDGAVDGALYHRHEDAPADGAEAIGGCAFTVFTAISFHFVTSLAEEATAGTASATARPSTASRPVRMGFIALVLFSPRGLRQWQLASCSGRQESSATRSRRRGGSGLHDSSRFTSPTPGEATALGWASVAE